MKQMRFGIPIIVFFLPWLCSANGILLPKIINFDKEAYQAHNQNWAATQASSGIMYFANNLGILEFDGLAWQSHLLPAKQIPRSVSSDSKGRVYSGGYGEFGYWERDLLGQLKYYSISAGKLQGEALREEFWHILVTEEAIYFQSFSSLFEWKDQQLKKLAPPGNIMFLRQVNQRIIVPVIRDGLYELLDDGRFQAIPGSDIFNDKTVSCLLPWNDQFIIGTEKAGLFTYDGVSFVPWEVEVNALFKKYQLNKGIRLKNGYYALGTILEGAFIIDEKGQIIFHFNQANGLQNNTILSITQDTNDNLWLGLDSGISLIPLGQPLLFYQDLAGIIGSVYAAAIFKDKLYIGTNRGLFYRHWPMLKEEEFLLVEGMQGQTWDLMVIDNQLLCGHNEGAFLVTENGSVEQLSTITGGWKFCPLPSSPDRLILATYTGLVLFTKDADNKWQFQRRIANFRLPVRNLKKVPGENNFWAVIPNEGLFQLKLNVNMDSVIAYTHYQKDRGFPGKYQIDLQALDTNVIVQTEGLSFVYMRARDIFKPMERMYNHGYYNPIKYYWLDGKNFFSVQDQFIHYADDDRMLVKLPLRLIPGYELIKEIDDSLILFGLDEGFALLQQEKIELGMGTPSPFLKTITFSSRKIDAVQIQLSDEGLLEVEPGANDVHFEFSNPVFTHPTWIRFRLLPFQQEWSEWSALNHKSYTNLPPGPYVLELQSNTSSAVFKQGFRIRSFWYQTQWVLIPYFLLIGLVIFLINRWQKKRLLKQQNKMLLEKEKQFRQERTQLLNEQLQKDILYKSQELANSTFNLIRKNEILITIKEELKKSKSVKGNSQQNEFQHKVIHLIDRHLDNNHDWEVFEENFNEVHEVFLKKLMSQYADLTPGDLKLAAYLRMNLSSKEIAPLLNISIRGVENKRYRLRKKLNLPIEENLTEFMINF